MIKTIQLEGEAFEVIFNELFFGFVLEKDEDDRQEVVLIEKKALLDASIPSGETEKRRSLLQDDGSTYTVGMNTTSLVFALWLEKDEDSEQGSLDDDHDEGDDHDDDGGDDDGDDDGDDHDDGDDQDNRDDYDEDLEEEERSQGDCKDYSDKDLEEVVIPLHK